MNLKSLVVFLLATGLLLNASYGQTTERPKVEEQSVPYVKIKRVELTDKYTIVYLQFEEKNSPQEFAIPPGLKLPPGFKMPQQTNDDGKIWLDPETRLYKPGEINVKFKLIKAENISTTQKTRVTQGTKIDFAAYFERLTPGIETFDFYEGRAKPSKNEYTWNFYGIHITNPLKKPVAKASKPLPKKEEPKKEELVPKDEPIVKEQPEKKTPETEKPESQLAVVKGTVFDAKTKQPISAQISYFENGDSLDIKSSSGKYRIGLDSKGIYDLRVTAKGYFGANLAFNPSDSAGKQSFTSDIYLAPLSVGETVSLPNIYFETSQFSLLPESSDELNRLAQMMKDNPNIKIRVEGHTDKVGDSEKNIELSRSRAEAVKEYLLQKGIDDNRIEARGYGATRPISKSNAEEERRKNRRVEFVVTEN